MAGAKLILCTWIAGIAAGSLSGHAIDTHPSPSAAMMVSPAAATPPSVATSSKRTFERAKDGLFYVTGLVNGAPVRFLVDTGANVVVLTDADARRVGVASDASKFDGQVDTANGSSPVAWVKLAQIDVAGRTVRDVDAAIPSGDLKVSLLGQNLLSRLDGLAIERERLTIH